MSEPKEALESENSKKGAQSKNTAKREDCESLQTEETSETTAQGPVNAKSKKKVKADAVENNCNLQQVPAPQKKRRTKKVSVTNSDASLNSKREAKQRKRKPKNKNMDQSLEGNAVRVKEENNGDDVQPNVSDEKIDWSQKDLAELIKRMELALPDKDNLTFRTRAEKLNWNDIAFKEYLAEDCKRTWLLIQKRVRGFRLLNEVLQDAKDWISKPWTHFYRGHKTKRHPDMPRRPLSVYMQFYLKNKDNILAENPGLKMTELSKRISQMYKGISPAEREKYMQLASEERKVYEGKVDEFYRSHPEIPRYTERVASAKPVESEPKKPQTPFGLYYEEQLKNLFSDSEVDRNTFKEQCKEQWKNMLDRKKVVWIDLALDQETKYQDELKNYISQNPNFVPVALKPVLTKEEKIVKERLAGKPIKPPNSAYSLFSKMMVTSDEITKMPPKDRMKAVTDQWKSCTEKEKKRYQERCSNLMEQYKLDFATYLESLSEDKRKEELQNNPPKRKNKETDDSELVAKKKKDTPAKNGELALLKVFESQPADSADPPVSGFSLFSKRYHEKLPVETASKTFSKLEKREYEAEVQTLKNMYIKEYEQFLNSLTKEQLTAFSQLKRKKEEASSNDIKLEECSSCDSASDSESSHDKNATKN